MNNPSRPPMADHRPSPERIEEIRRRDARNAFAPDPWVSQQILIEDVPWLLGEVSLLAEQVDALTAELDEMRALRDNALRQAEAPTDTDLPGLIGDALAGLGWEWETENGDPPADLVNAAAAAVGPAVDRLEQQVARLEEQITALREGRSDA